MTHQDDNPTIEDLWRRLLDLAHRPVAAVFDQIKQAWRHHRDQVSTNPAYAAALGAAVTAVVELFTHDPRLLTVLAAFVALYVAIHRATHPDPLEAVRRRLAGRRRPLGPRPRLALTPPERNHPSPRQPAGGFVMSEGGHHEQGNPAAPQHQHPDRQHRRPRPRLALPSRRARRRDQPLPGTHPGRRRRASTVPLGSAVAPYRRGDTGVRPDDDPPDRRRVPSPVVRRRRQAGDLPLRHRRT